MKNHQKKSIIIYKEIKNNYFIDKVSKKRNDLSVKQIMLQYTRLF